MKMYTQYTNNYESASKILEQSAEDRDYLFQFIQVSPPPLLYRVQKLPLHDAHERERERERERYTF